MNNLGAGDGVVAVVANAAVEALALLEGNRTERKLADAHCDPSVLAREALHFLDVNENRGDSEVVDDQEEEAPVQSPAENPVETTNVVVLEGKLRFAQIAVGVVTVPHEGNETHDGVQDNDKSDEDEAPLIVTEVAPRVLVTLVGRSVHKIKRAGRSWEVGSSMDNANPNDHQQAEGGKPVLVGAAFRAL